MSEQILTFEQWRERFHTNDRMMCHGHRCYTQMEPHWYWCPVCGKGFKPIPCQHTRLTPKVDDCVGPPPSPPQPPCDPVIVVEDKEEYNGWERCYVKCQVCGASTKGRLNIASAINGWNCCGIFDIGKDTYEE